MKIDKIVSALWVLFIITGNHLHAQTSFFSAESFMTLVMKNSNVVILDANKTKKYLMGLTMSRFHHKKKCNKFRIQQVIYGWYALLVLDYSQP